MGPIRLNLPLLRQPVAVSRSLPRKLAPLVRRTRTAAFLQFRRSEVDDPRATKLAGQPYLPVGEPWPTCDQCGRPMHHLFQINFAEADFPALSEAVLLTFFYCIGCSPNDQTEPGWAIRLREDLEAPAAHHPLPEIPPQQDQPLPIWLLHNHPQTATVRTGPDLPDLFDSEVDRLMSEVDEDAPPYGYASPGVTHYLRLRLRKEGEEPFEWNAPSAFAPADPEEWARQTFGADGSQVEYVEFHLLPPPPPGRIDVWDVYEKYLHELAGSEDRPVSKIGGWIHDIQTPRFVRCGCGEPLEHIVTIRTTIYTPYVVGDIGAIYLMGCPSPDCRHGGLHWWADWS